MFFLFRLIGVMILSLLLASNTFAEPTAIGKVLWVKGALKANQPNQAPRTLTRRSDIYENDTLTTDAKSTGEIAFTDNSLLSLRENTIMEITKYRYGKNVPKDQESYVEKITKGGFRKITGAISKDNPDGYQTTTPVATIGVLGTQYSIYYTPGKDGMAAKLEKGSIYIQNQAGKVVLKKCTQEEVHKANCKDKVYSRVTSENSAPEILETKPQEFENDVPIYKEALEGEPCAYCSIGTESSVVGSDGLVSSFCIK